jgi:hypothetical protein
MLLVWARQLITLLARHCAGTVLWSEPGLQSFVPSPKGSRTGPDTADAGGACTRSRRVVRSVPSGGEIRTPGLQVMSLTSCLCSTPHGSLVAQLPEAVKALAQITTTIGTDNHDSRLRALSAGNLRRLVNRGLPQLIL